MAKVNQRIACKAIIVNEDGRVLLLREAAYDEGSNAGLYGVPGGRINSGEPFLDGLAREVMEETGLTVKVGTPVHVGEWFPVIQGVKNQIVAVFFACEYIGGDIKLSEEHDDYKWVDEYEVKQLNVMSDEVQALDNSFALHTGKR